MSTTANEPATPSLLSRSYRLQVSSYDQAASGLIAALMFVGAGVAVLLLLFFSSRIFVRQTAVPISMVDASFGEGSPRGSGSDLNEPAGDDVPDELQQDAPPEAVESITAAVSSRASQFDDPTLETAFTTGKGGGRGDGRGTGKGRAGPQEAIPRPQRWVLHFDGGNLKTYARQLDFFKIELAAVGKDNLVRYAFNLSKPRPDQRSGSPDAEQRLYMTWRSGPLQQADRELLTKAGIEIDGRVIMQFYPAEVEQMLARLEREYAGNKDINDIRRTTFDVRSNGDKFVFVVTGQQTY